MTDEDYMLAAIAQAQKAGTNGGLPLGAVVVKEGEIIVSGTSHVGDFMDPTAHGESLAIRNACKKLNTLNLSECILYTTLEPCSMCLACASWCGLKRIVFGSYRTDIPENPYEMDNYHAEAHARQLTPIGGGSMIVDGGVLRKECAALMQHMVNWTISDELQTIHDAMK